MQDKIYIFTTPHAWQHARQTGYFATPSLKDEGFIHASAYDQLPWVAHKFYRDVPEVLLITVDVHRLTSELKWEAPSHPDGSQNTAEQDAWRFPHIYGRLNLDAILTVQPTTRDDQGNLILP